MERSEMRRLRQLEDDTRRLTHIVAEHTLDIQAKIVADQTLDIQAKAVVAQKWLAPSRGARR